MLSQFSFHLNLVKWEPAITYLANCQLFKFAWNLNIMLTTVYYVLNKLCQYGILIFNVKS